MRRGRGFAVRTLAGGCFPFVIVACGFTGLGTGPEASTEAGADKDSTAATEGSADGTTVEIEGSIDARADAGEASACPITCNGGCAGGVCRVDNPNADITCPAGMPCRVVCTGTQACVREINCGAATTCQLECTGDQACNSVSFECGGAAVCALTCGNPSGCNSVKITPGGATALCVACVSGSACNSVSCESAPASMKCTSTCDVSACGLATTVAKCP